MSRWLPRPTSLAFLVAALALAARAQPIRCEGGFVSHRGETFACDQVDLLAWITLQDMGAESGNDSWGWTDPESGREYALMGLDTGTFFVDITEPTQPRLLGKLPAQSLPNLWRDMAVHAGHMYVVSEAAEHGMQVFDLRRLRGLTPDASRRFEADRVFTGEGDLAFFRAHTIAVNEAAARVYPVGARVGEHFVCEGGLLIIDVSEPLSPTSAGCFGGDGYIHDVQCVIYAGPDPRYRGRDICFASSPARAGFRPEDPQNTLTIIDATEPQAPRALSRTTYPQQAFTHQGWLSEDQRYFFLNDEGDEFSFGHPTRNVILDVSDLENPFYVGSYFYPSTAISHNLYIREDFLFAANYTSGLHVLDISRFVLTGDAQDIALVGHFDTFPDPPEAPVTAAHHGGKGFAPFRGAWSNYPFFPSGNVIISDIDRGLFVVRPRRLDVAREPDPSPSPITVHVFPNPVRDALTVQLRAQHAQRVRIELFDLLGRHVRTLLYEPFPAQGDRLWTFDLEGIGAGTYLLRVSGDAFAQSHLVTRLE